MLNIITSPSILNSNVFMQYGGCADDVGAGQLNAAFAIAEGLMQEEIGTLLSPTVITGTHTWPPLGQPLMLEYDRIRSIESVVAIHDAGCDCADDSIELTGCAWILDAESGIIDVRECGDTLKASCAGCGCYYGSSPFQVRVVYTAGLTTGSHSDPRLLMGLVTAAQMQLDQMTNPAGGEGGAGNPGVKSFSSLSYSETRVDASYQMTAFGASAKANYIAQLVKPFKVKRAMKLGW